MTESFVPTMTQYLQAEATGFWVHTYEEARAIADVQEVSRGFNALAVRWSPNFGMRDLGTGKMINHGGADNRLFICVGYMMNLKLLNDQRPWIFVIPDAHLLFEGERGKKEAADLLKEVIVNKLGTIVCVSPNKEVPLELRRVVTSVPFTLPDMDTLQRCFSQEIDEPAWTKTNIRQLSEAAIGSTIGEARLSFRIASQRHGKKKIPDIVQEVWDTKAKQFEDRGLIRVVTPTDKWEHVGGMRNLKPYLEQIAPLLVDPGLLTSNGILLTGFQGGGKSLLSRAYADYLSKKSGRQWKYIEWKSAYSKWLGETERQVEEQIELTELHAPCILRIDEISHAFSGQGGGASDAGVTERKLGRHLTWLEERKPGIFIMANTNQPWDLPPHMARPGRFNSGIWYVPIPGRQPHDAVGEILDIHINKYFPRMDDAGIEDVRALIFDKHMTGDEIEQSLLEAGRMCHPEDPTMDAVMTAARTITPMYDVRREDFVRLQEWALVQKRAKEA